MSETSGSGSNSNNKTPTTTSNSKKRTSSDAGLDSPVSSKDKRILVFEPLKLFCIQSAEELDAKLLLIQNKKLSECLTVYRKNEEKWKDKIDQVERNKAVVDCKFSIIDIYWTQLDEDIRRLLERFDSTVSSERDEVKSFIQQLNMWMRDDLDEHLKQRLDFSTKAIVKLVKIFDSLSEKYQRLFSSLNSSSVSTNSPNTSTFGDSNNKTVTDDSKLENLSISHEVHKAVLERNSDLEQENNRILRMNTTLQSQIHTITLQCSDLSNQLALQEEQTVENKSHISDLEYELEKSRSKEMKLERLLCDAISKLETDNVVKDQQEGTTTVTIPEKSLTDLRAELEECRELATSRLTELEKLTFDHETAKKEIEELKCQLRALPESLVTETPEFKCLQSRYTALVNESVHLRHQLAEARELVKCTKAIYDHHFEKIEQEEYENQRKLHANIEQVVEDLAEAKRAYDMLQLEYEKILIANQQAVPITREMRSLIGHLQVQCNLHNSEASRSKRQCKEMEDELTKLRMKNENNSYLSSSVTNQLNGFSETETPNNHNTTNSATKDDSHQLKPSPHLQQQHSHKEDLNRSNTTTEGNDDNRLSDVSILDIGDISEDEIEESQSSISRLTSDEKETEIRSLKNDNKKLTDLVKEYKILLTMYRSAPKETREKATLMTSEKKLRQELDDTKSELKKLQTFAKTIRKKFNEDEAQNKIRTLQDSVRELEKNLETRKQEEAALLNEIEVTGQAFEDMQEQNSRLLQQLREKDDAHIKLMVERVKSQQEQKIMSEEKTVLIQQTNVLREQLDVQVVMNQKFEETVALLRNSILILEKELNMMHQTLDAHKRKSIECAQTSADLRLHLERYHAQLKEAQQLVAEKTELLEKQNFKNRRLQEDNKNYSRKLERMRKFDMASNKDEVLLEEIREYKEILRCPACKNKQRDAILSKCFHVFCYDCLKSRYDSRQRKCPKCNLGFAVQDIHKIYLS
ncbi:unnamed protein product [Didymodactylos carnosus]|uniref:E3 ubiquitin protein ligase n=1 Tax=Didymodactylos carnosus TaxID=1234261 RepID=A0A813NLW3_9BILA|nr:unnamed protein product [Didymodactylos carnosus]CAF3517618.1 unnamed protein product [Didymodactylos carnosus]